MRLDRHRVRHILLCLTGVAVGAGSSGDLAAQEAEPHPPRWYEQLRFAGDIRLRHDSFLFPDSTPDGRFRLRLRLGFTVPVANGVTAGVRFATVEPGSVTSENITLTGETAPKTVQLTGAWVAWQPVAAVTLTGGKFGMAQARPPGALTSEVVYDDDLAPEGFHQMLRLVDRDAGLVRRVTLLGDQWSLRVVRDSVDAWLLGGQAAAELAPFRRARLAVAGGYQVFHNGRALAQARNDNRRLLVTNAVELTDGTIVDAGKPVSPTAGNPFLRFHHGFRLVTGSATLTVERLLWSRPLSVFVDAVHNAGATGHRSGYAAGASVGGLRRTGDWSVSATRVRIEREAVLSLFNGSDFGLGGTNAQGAILHLQFRPAPGVTLSARDHLVRAILPVDGIPDGWYHRVLLDVAIMF